MKTIISVLATLLIFSLNCKGQLYSSPARENTLLVKGTAIMKQIPELIYVSVNVTTESEDYSDCQNRLLVKIEKVKDALVKQGINKDLIKTSEISINERKEYISGKPVSTGYIGSITVIIETAYSVEISSKILAAFKTDSLALNYNVGFRLSEKQKAAMRKEAITLAIDDAKEKASLIAQSSNIKLLNINSVTYLDDDMSFMRDRDIIREVVRSTQNSFVTVRGTDQDTPSIDFNPKEIGIIKSVRIEWTIEGK